MSRLFYMSSVSYVSVSYVSVFTSLKLMISLIYIKIMIFSCHPIIRAPFSANLHDICLLMGK